jgi:hypothetical protein
MSIAAKFRSLFWAIIAGRRRTFPGFAISTLFMLSLSAVVVGGKGLVRYPGYLLALNRSTGVGIFPQLQMNLRGLLTLFVGRAPYPGRIHWVLAPAAIAAVIYSGILWRKAGNRFLAEGVGLAAIAGIVTSYYAYSYDLLLLIVPLLAMRSRPNDSPREDRWTRVLEMAGLLPLLLTPTYWFSKELHNQCIMTIPPLVLAFVLARRLRLAGVETSAQRRLSMRDGPG